MIKKSPLFYIGDKWKLYNEISNYFPENINDYYEPFAGGASVAMNINVKGKKNINDIEDSVINLHKRLFELSKNEKLDEYFLNMAKDKGLITFQERDIIESSIKSQYPKTYFAKMNSESFLNIRKEFNKTKDYDLLYLLIIYGFNRMIRFNKNREFNVPPGNLIINENVINNLKDYQKFTKEDVKFTNLDYISALEKVKEEDFVYLDPPYLITNNKYNSGWEEKDEIKFWDFIDDLNERNIKFAISNVSDYNGKENLILKERAKNYNIFDINNVNYINHKNNKDKKMKEILITNYGNESKKL